MKKKILITGSKGLIGSKISEEFKKEYIFDYIDLKDGFDLTDEGKVDLYFKKNKNYYAVIIAHGYNPQQNTAKNDPLKVSSQEIRSYFEHNLISCFNVNRYYIKYNKKGRLINISSLYGLVSPNHKLYGKSYKHIGYSLSKASVIMMTKYLATLYGPNFLVNCIVIGGIYNSQIKKKFVKNYEEFVPHKKMMRSREVVPIFKFLLDKDNTYTNGSVLVSDGGWTSI